LPRFYSRRSSSARLRLSGGGRTVRLGKAAVVGFGAILRTTIFALVASAAAFSGPALAHGDGDSGGLTLLRDTEIEADVHRMMTPIWRAAGLDPDAMHVYVVADPAINSFVASGQNIFINSGLLLQADTPNQLIGVLSHETGHIAGGHLERGALAMHNAGVEGLIFTALGAAAAVLSRGGEGGAALLGGQEVAARAYAQFSVTQEATADHAALNYLDATRQSARGLLQFFEKLQTETMLTGAYQDPYLRDHPLTQERIDYVREHVRRSPYSNLPDPPAYIAMFRRIRAKLAAFIEPPSRTLARYPQTDQSVVARYARAIAYYRIPQLDRALATIDRLIRDYPSDPYFRELKGQMLFENGHIQEAVAPYEAAVHLAPNAPLLRIALAQVYIETNDPALDKRAIGYLDVALRSEDQDLLGWHLLATAYGRDHQIGMAALALAEEGLAAGKKRDAVGEAKRAQHLLPKSSAGFMRAIEVQREAEQLDSSD
jgi:predicted Zn-dependent protease